MRDEKAAGSMQLGRRRNGLGCRNYLRWEVIRT